MLQKVSFELNNEAAILYTSKKLDRNEENDYESDDEYVLITDPIKRISDMKY